jgi:hypothetical protein
MGLQGKGANERKDRIAHGCSGNKKTTGVERTVAVTSLENESYRATGALRESRFLPLATAARIFRV